MLKSEHSGSGKGFLIGHVNVLLDAQEALIRTGEPSPMGRRSALQESL